MYTNEEFELYYDFLIDMKLAEEPSIDLALGVGGNNTDTLKAILCYYTGYSDIESYVTSLGIVY